MSAPALFPPPEFAGTFRTDPAARAVYSEAAGIHRLLPAAVAVAADTEDVATLVRWARTNGIAITPRGSGSSMAGGAVGAGVILDVSRLDDIGAVDVERSTVRCGPGALRDTIDQAARAHGLRFPVDPSSGRFCTIGGMVATNAAGAHSLGFGATARWVNAIDCVFADGTAATLRRGEQPPVSNRSSDQSRATAGELPIVARALAVLESCHAEAGAFHRTVRKDSSGYGIGRWLESGDLLDVIVGSEGTLAIVTAVELQLAPVARATASVLAAFADLDTAAAGAATAREQGAVVCELLDATFLELARDNPIFARLPEGTSVVLLAELEAMDEAEVVRRAAGLELEFALAGALAARRAIVPGAQRELWELRHAASPMLSQLDPSLRSVQVIEDGAVPPEELPRYIAALRAALAAAGVRAVIFGHAGDAHVHVNPLVDVTRPGWRTDLEKLLATVTDAVAELGGTMTGEHGDGRLRAPLLSRTWPPEAVRKFEELKRAFDPDGILNPEVKLPLPGQRPLAEVKYDPELDALPTAARRALDRVADERLYAESRLSLLEAGS